MKTLNIISLRLKGLIIVNQGLFYNTLHPQAQMYIAVEVVTMNED